MTDMDTVYLTNGATDAEAQAWQALGQQIGLTEFNPTIVNWNVPAAWKAVGSGGVIMEEHWGYVICILFGVFFSVVTFGLTYLEKKYGGVVLTSEHFNTAGRNVKIGLTASVIVSQWTWAATLLQSSNVAWSFGLSGPFWYAAGASIQVLLFGILAIEIKRKAPNSHTFLEMVDVRWGKFAHITFMYYGFCTNIIVTSMLLLGGASVMNAASGMSTDAANFLIPLGTIFYTVTGGLKATFLASYIHTSIIFIGLVVFICHVYMDAPGCELTPPPAASTQCNTLGSAGMVYERLQFVAALNPVVDNRQGSYLTMLSVDGLKFGVINVVGNFGTVFVDQSYWQSAIAASPASAHKGYMLGGLVWFTIPFALATSLGLAGRALNADLVKDDANAGLVPPGAATVLMGPGGGWLIIIMLFMAITSTGSAEMIAVSSLVTYDIYRKYVNPEASGEDILKYSRIICAAYGVVMGAFATALNYMGLTLGWVYNFMGIMIGSAVAPIFFLLCWKDCTATGAIGGAIGGNILSVMVWLITAGTIPNPAKGDETGVVSKDTTGLLDAQLAGNMTAICMSAIICVALSIKNPQNFDWEIMRTGIKIIDGQAKPAGVSDWEMSEEFLLEAKAWILKYGVSVSIFLIVGWPLLTLPWGVFPKAIFALWTSVAVCWGFLAALIIIGLPIIENWATISAVLMLKPDAAPANKMAAVAAEVPATTATSTA